MWTPLARATELEAGKRGEGGGGGGNEPEPIKPLPEPQQLRAGTRRSRAGEGQGEEAVARTNVESRRMSARVQKVAPVDPCEGSSSSRR